MAFPANSGHVAIFGQGESGKTTLAVYLSRKNFRLHGIRSLCLDPIRRIEWGPQATVFTVEQTPQFWSTVSSTRGNLLFIEEGFETIGKDRELVPYFTRIRHLDHKMVVSGHLATETLLPIMRQQIGTLFLSKASKRECQLWAEQLVNDDVYLAMKLSQGEFLCVRRWQQAYVIKPEQYAV